MKTLVVFAHGARDPAWARPVEQLAARLRDTLTGWTVEAAYLERMTPGIDETLDALAARGVREIALLPVFWSAQGHVDQAVPMLAERMQARGVVLRALPVLSDLPGLLDYVAETATRLALRA